MGIGAYNEECRSIVMRYSKEWEAVVHRLGRWIDFEKGYKTLDPPYMESVWWVFRQLWDKGLVYRGFKVRRWKVPFGDLGCGIGDLSALERERGAGAEAR
jgi:isoleucyl-tRNA synthetase